MKRRLKRQKEQELEMYKNEYQILVNWFLNSLFFSPFTYLELYSKANEIWGKYCNASTFKTIKPDSFLFHENFKPLERI